MNEISLLKQIDEFYLDRITTAAIHQQVVKKRQMKYFQIDSSKALTNSEVLDSISDHHSTKSIRTYLQAQIDHNKVSNSKNFS